MRDIGNVVVAFTEEQVAGLTGLTKRQLRYWSRTDFFSPAYIEDDPDVPYGRLYSFKNIVALRTLAVLRVQYKVPLQHLRRVAEKLAHLRDDLWTQTRLWVLDREVVFENPETGVPQVVVSGQYVIDIPLSRIVADTDRDVARLRERSSSQVGHVAQSKGVASNARVLSGTRIHADSIKRLHDDGFTTQQIIGEFPDLTELDVEAALGDGKAAA